MRRTFQLLFGTLLLVLLGSAEAKALLSQNRVGDEWRSTPKYRVMGYEEKAPGRFAFCPQLKLQLAMGCDVRGEEIASGQGKFLSADPLGHAASMDLYSYCNGDPVNGLDPDGRQSAPGAANVESDGNSLPSTGNSITDLTNQMALDQLHEQMYGSQPVSVGDVFNGLADLAGDAANVPLQAGVGIGNDLWGAATGQDAYTDQPLSGGQRFEDAGSVAMNFTPLAELDVANELRYGASGVSDGLSGAGDVSGAAEGGGSDLVTLYHGTTSNAASKIVSGGLRDADTFFAEEMNTSQYFASEAAARTGASSTTTISFTMPRSVANDLGLLDRQVIGTERNLPTPDIDGGSGFERILPSENVSTFNSLMEDGTITTRRLKH